MNSKASRQELSLPLLLNMSNNQPQVFSDFKTAERVNAPYINGCMSPHYSKTIATESETTFDKDNNIYTIKNGYLCRNNNQLFPVNNKKFVQTEVTSQYIDYLSFDYDNNGDIATLSSTENNTVTIQYKQINYKSITLFSVGRILTSRIRVLNNKPIAVVVYVDIDAVAHIFIYDGVRYFSRKITWCTQTPKQTYSSSSRFTQKAIKSDDIYPIIQISSPINNTIAISLVTNFGKQLNTLTEAYYTFIEDYTNGNFIDGLNAQPSNETRQGEVATTLYDNFTLSNTYNSSYKVVSMYKKDGIWYNQDDNSELPIQDHIDPILTTQTITIDDIEYDIFTQNYWTMTYEYTATQVLQTSKSYTLYLTHNEDIQSSGFTNNEAKITFTVNDWSENMTEFTLSEAYIQLGEDKYDFENSTLAIPTNIIVESGTIGWVIGPNVFLDDGTIRSWWTINTWETATSSWTPASQVLTVDPNIQNIIVESANLTSVDYTNKTFGFSPVEWHKIDDASRIIRNNCISVGQKFWNNTAMLCSTTLRTPKQLYVDNIEDPTLSSSAKYTVYSNSNANDMRYYGGVFPNSDYKFYSSATESSNDVAWYDTGGFRISALGNWNILYYNFATTISNIQSLSYSEAPDIMGTVVVPWNTIDQNFYIVFTENFIIYKDVYNKYWKVEIVEGNELYSLLDNTFIVVNTTSYWNCYDAVNHKKYHYASDYNNRIKYGISRVDYTNEVANKTVVNKDSRLAASGINTNFNASNEQIASLQAPLQQLSYLYSERANVKVYRAEAPNNILDVQLVDVFFQGVDEGSEVTYNGVSYTAARYKYSVLAQNNQSFIRQSYLVDSTYIGTSINYTPDIFSKYINNAGNNDFINENGIAYPIAFSVLQKPVFMYSLSGGIQNVTAFFVLQGQYYATTNDKLYALSYYNGTIQNQDAIVDIRGMKFVGNTPQIAFFWSEKKKAFYSYTGDGVLTQIFDATKYSLVDFQYKYYYDETVQSIWIPTTAGLLCFAVDNTYLMENIKNVHNMIFTDDYTYIIQDNQYTVLKYFYEDGFDPVNVELETCFYGAGNNEVSTIDRWQITLFDERKPQCEIKLGVRSLTDVTVKSEEKVFKIGPNDWDQWSNSILLSYTPQLIKGQGLRLYINSPCAIMKIVPHVADQNYTSTTRYQM